MYESNYTVMFKWISLITLLFVVIQGEIIVAKNVIGGCEKGNSKMCGKPNQNVWWSSDCITLLTHQQNSATVTQSTYAWKVQKNSSDWSTSEAVEQPTIKFDWCYMYEVPAIVTLCCLRWGNSTENMTHFMISVGHAEGYAYKQYIFE